MISPETIDKIVELAIRPQSSLADEFGDPYVVLPQSMQVYNLSHLCPPQRIKQAPKFLECGSFVDYVNRFRNENTLIFANVTDTSATFHAVLDYHAAAPKLAPAFCHHTATFQTIETPEWKTWLGANRKSMEQVEFATWLEDNARLLVEPTGADLLELVKSLHGHKNARFSGAARLDTGAYSVSYEEEIVVRGTSKVDQGDIELPATIKAGIAPFQGSQPYEVNARLKTRVVERKLTLWFETISLHSIVRDSIMLLTKQVAEKTGIIPFLGNP